ncbi:hypothetical protein LCGC14_2718940 [marine sediment metagenome]|uniref:LysR substrate-binding domain-containing protein n=1 Tax=marine sediment metagenome TaxID=412755 RepID=A0A0F8ZAJ2_9ZZZZ
MDCEQIRDLLDAYSLGAAEEHEAAVLEEHVADCVRCWSSLNEAQRVAASLALSTALQQAPESLRRRILAEAERTELAVTRLHATPRGTLRVDAPLSFGIRYIAPALPEFMRRYPELRVDLTLTDRFVNLVEEGYDLAIRIAHLPDSSLIARKLSEKQLGTGKAGPA